MKEPIKVERLAGQMLPEDAVMYDDRSAISNLVYLPFEEVIETTDPEVLRGLLLARVENARQECLKATGWKEEETNWEVIEYPNSPHQLVVGLRRVLVRKKREEVPPSDAVGGGGE